MAKRPTAPTEDPAALGMSAASNGDSFERPTAAQQQAIEHAGSPLIVLAGPGTGKTRVIIHRVAHLIEARGVEPEHILVTTFTVKAARQLRQRLAGLIGLAKADRINAHTFNGLGLRLLRRFADVAGLPPIGDLSGGPAAGGGAGPRSLRMIDSAQSRRMLARLILDHDLFGPERAAGVHAIIAAARGYFEFFANSGLTPAQAIDLADRWRTACDQQVDLDGRGLEEHELAAQRVRQARFAAMAELNRLFADQRRRQGFITYGDQILLAISLLRDNPDVAAVCRDDFRHIIVDEFQDVNQANIELLRLLAAPEHHRSKARLRGQELVVVGDDDQAIYGFRGSDDQAFWRFARIWPDAVTLPLVANFRSRPNIIRLAAATIARAEERFAPGKVCEFPENKPVEPPGLVECVNLTNDKTDGEVVAALLRTAARTHPPADAPADSPRWRRYAVVCRTNSDVARICTALWLEGIPTEHEAHSASDDEGVQQALAWARLLVEPREPWAAYRILARPPFSFPVDRIGSLDRQYRAAVLRWRRSDDGGLAGAPDDPGTFPQWLSRCEGNDPMVARFVGLHDALHAEAATSGGADMLVRIVRDTGLVHADLVIPDQRARRLASVVALLRFAAERQDRLPPPGGLRELIEYYDDLDSEEQNFSRDLSEEAIDGPRNDAGDETVDAVRVLTAHKAKGLEFHTVFVPRVHPQYGYGKTTGSSDGPDIPDQLRERAGPVLTDKDRARAEERRIFYVACTRAEHRLVLLARRNKKPSKDTINFFEEIVLDPGLSKLVRESHEAEVLRLAAEDDSNAAPREPDAARHVRRAADGSADEQRRELLSAARREVRIAAAAMLGRVDSAALATTEFDDARARLAGLAARLSGIARLEASLPLPPWTPADDPALARLAADLQVIADSRAARAADHGFVAPRPPLWLSYTVINDYTTCPRCWYLKHRLGFFESGGPQQALGIALHATMQRFYERFRARDSGGGALPDLAALERIAREEFFAHAGAGATRNHPFELDQLLHQVRLCFCELHDPSAQVLEVERAFRFKYRCAAPGAWTGDHDFEAKIDRVDQITLADGRAGFRIVDYKTGRPSNRLIEPGRNDLQLGIYALALREHFGVDVEGVAEYWLCQTGERGQLNLSDIDFDKLRGTIDEAVTGMLSGQYAKGKNCQGGCAILGP